MPPKKPKIEASSSGPAPRVKSKKVQLWEACNKAKGIGGIFSVPELEALGVSENDNELKDLAQSLLQSQMFCLLTQNGAFFYRTRPLDLASKLQKLNGEGLMIYQAVENSGSKGTWKRHLQMTTNLHENTVGRVIKDLIANSLVKPINSAKHPTRRMYMLAGITPSSENAGGNFYTDGLLDEGLIEQVGMLIVAILEKLGWAEQKEDPKKLKELRKHKSSKRKHDDIDDGTTLNGGFDTKQGIIDRPLFEAPKRNGKILVPHPPDFDGYPDVEKVLKLVNDADIITGKSLNSDDIQQLLDKLEHDGQIERMRRPDGQLTKTYRSVRRSWQSTGSSDYLFGPIDLDHKYGSGLGNGLTESPCGRCPVFKQCRPGGVVSPETCVYMDEWLMF